MRLNDRGTPGDVRVVAPAAAALALAVLTAVPLSGGPAAADGISIDGPLVRAETRTLSAVIERGLLTSLVRKSDGRELVRAAAKDRTGAYLIYPNGEAVPLGGWPQDRFTPLRINDHRAEVRIEAWDGDGILAIEADPESGDLIVELGAYSSRPGVRACRWLLAGIDPELELVAPFFQGIRMPLEDPLIHDTRWVWPMRWGAALAILQGRTGGFWVHARDTRYIYKTLQVGTEDEARALGFDTEAYGPNDDNLSAGGLAWRINVYDGDWTVPASSYRDWLAGAYGLEQRVKPSWIDSLRLAVSWCPTDPAVLDALARKISPDKVLLHVPDWRTDRYDENYPDYVASSRGAALIRKAQEMGFHAMPHFNSVDMDPSNPVFELVRDFKFRLLDTKRVFGWTWTNGTGERPVPESNADLLRHRDLKTMVKVHPGLGMWRSILAERVRTAAEALSLDAVFLDVTLNTHNLWNSLVENTTATEGMKRLEAAIGGLGAGLAVGGEGRNEITMQDQALSQVHLFLSWQTNVEGLERLKTCPLSEFLFGRWSRSFGYSDLGGKTPASELRMRMHVALGGIPTVTIGSAEEIERPNRAVREMLDLALR